MLINRITQCHAKQCWSNWMSFMWILLNQTTGYKIRESLDAFNQLKIPQAYERTP